MGDETSKALVAMSGGVDSSVAAALLLEQGWAVAGVTMRLPQYRSADSAKGDGGSDSAIDDARRVAEKLGIGLTVLDCRHEFERTVVADFCDAYRCGRTPNPCARCNERMKFGLLLERARSEGYPRLATGHYVRREVDPRTGRAFLRRGLGADEQSYFLYGLTQEQLRGVVFPMAELVKNDARRLAEELGLPIHDKPKSQDLCFLPDGGYRDFLRSRCPEAFRPGDVVHMSGGVVGRHEGIADYTVGQRRGLGIAHSEPLYVLSVDPDTNTVVVGEREHLLRRTLVARDVNWMAAEPGSSALRAVVKIRYNHAGADAELTPDGDGAVRVRFAEPQEAPCPGQAVVFYRDDVVLGGGTIATSD